MHVSGQMGEKKEEKDVWEENYQVCQRGEKENDAILSMKKQRNGWREEWIMICPCTNYYTYSHKYK